MERSHSIFFVVVIFFSLTFSVFAEEVEQKFQGFNLQGYSETGQKSWEVNGDTANILGNDVKITNVNANVYGQQKANITAETGLVNQVSGKMHLEKNVTITSERGTQLTTNYLDWNRNEDLLTTEDKVFIVDQKYIAAGHGLKAHPTLKDGQLLKDVFIRANTQPEEKEPMWATITCDGPLTIDQAKSSAIFENNVVAVGKDRTLKADRVEIYFNQETNQMKEAVCIGNVRLTQGQNKTFAEKLIYHGLDQKLVLLGRPKVIMFTEDKNGFTASGN